eukprot:964704_1
MLNMRCWLFFIFIMQVQSIFNSNAAIQNQMANASSSKRSQLDNNINRDEYKTVWKHFEEKSVELTELQSKVTRPIYLNWSQVDQNDDRCYICSETDHFAQMVQCDDCNRFYHYHKDCEIDTNHDLKYWDTHEYLCINNKCRRKNEIRKKDKSKQKKKVNNDSNTNDSNTNDNKERKKKKKTTKQKKTKKKKKKDEHKKRDKEKLMDKQRVKIISTTAARLNDVIF